MAGNVDATYRQCGLCDAPAIATIADVRLCELHLRRIEQLRRSAIAPERERERVA